jgi:GDP-4-dehydro-6-deoxy-D-mannose reductase
MPDPKRLMVTGASGFVGQHLMHVLRQGFPSSILIACSNTLERDADIVLPLDLLDIRSIEDCLSEGRPDIIIHLAADANVGESFIDPWRTWRVNVDGALHISYTLMHTAPETILIYISSAEVYGLTFQQGIPLDENAPFAPSNPYSASKAAADLALGEMGLRGLRVIRVRPANHTGPGQSDKFVVPAFAKQIALIEAGEQEPVMHVGALDRWRDFLDVRDVCAAYAAVVKCASSLPNGIAINIASENSRRIGDILADLISRTNLDIKLHTDIMRLRPTDVMTVRCDAGRAHSLLQWAPKINWDISLDDILADWRNRIAQGSRVAASSP